jgi:hypothetical protein
MCRAVSRRVVAFAAQRKDRMRFRSAAPPLVRVARLWIAAREQFSAFAACKSQRMNGPSRGARFEAQQ